MKKLMITLAPVAAICAAMLAAPSAQASEAPCYDARVTADVRDEAPTKVPVIRDDRGQLADIDAWPWIVDLNVQNVREGSVSGNRLRVLSLQSSYLTRQQRDYYLRRNTNGGWNLVWPTSAQPLQLCAPDAAPARAYYTPPRGKSLEYARREGLRAYSRI